MSAHFFFRWPLRCLATLLPHQKTGRVVQQHHQRPQTSFVNIVNLTSSVSTAMIILAKCGIRRGRFCAKHVPRTTLVVQTGLSSAELMPSGLSRVFPSGSLGLFEGTTQQTNFHPARQRNSARATLKRLQPVERHGDLGWIKTIQYGACRARCPSRGFQIRCACRTCAMSILGEGLTFSWAAFQIHANVQPSVTEVLVHLLGAHA